MWKKIAIRKKLFGFEASPARRENALLFMASVDEVGCYHLLCKHTESRNPVSRRTGKQIDMSKADAIAELEQIKVDIDSVGWLPTQPLAAGAKSADADAGDALD